MEKDFQVTRDDKDLEIQPLGVMIGHLLYQFAGLSVFILCVTYLTQNAWVH